MRVEIFNEETGEHVPNQEWLETMLSVATSSSLFLQKFLFESWDEKARNDVEHWFDDLIEYITSADRGDNCLVGQDVFGVTLRRGTMSEILTAAGEGGNVPILIVKHVDLVDNNQTFHVYLAGVCKEDMVEETE